MLNNTTTTFSHGASAGPLRQVLLAAALVIVAPGSVIGCARPLAPRSTAGNGSPMTSSAGVASGSQSAATSQRSLPAATADPAAEARARVASLQSELATVNSALGDKSLAPDLRAELEREAARLREEIEIARVARSGEEQPPAATATPAVKAEQTLRSKAPDLVVRMSGGGEFDLSKQSGRATVVQFFATWSAPCKRALPELARLSKDLDGKADVVVIRVLSRDEKQDAKAAGGQERALTAATDLLRSIGAGALGERAAVDADGSISARWQTVAAVPDVYLIAPDGSVAQRWQGLGKETYSEIRRAVDLLNPKPPEAQGP